MQWWDILILLFAVLGGTASCYNACGIQHRWFKMFLDDRKEPLDHSRSTKQPKDYS